MRLFIAIQLSESMRNAISDVQYLLKRQGVRGNYTPWENLHLTLVFIGEYNDPDRVHDIIEHIPIEPFELSLNGMGAFGDLWWIGLEPSGGKRVYPLTGSGFRPILRCCEGRALTS